MRKSYGFGGFSGALLHSGKAPPMHLAAQRRFLNYRHSFKAGNHGDVLKHSVLLSVVKRMTRKDKPCMFLDTHASRGVFDLGGGEQERSGDSQSGVHKVMRMAAAGEELHPICAEWIEFMKTFNVQGRLDTYPGSPLVLKHHMRPKDRLVLSELQRDEAHSLVDLFPAKENKRVYVYGERDGFECWKGHIPPMEKRGMVLCDPPYERSDEYDSIVKGVLNHVKRWQTGTVIVWYPVKNNELKDALLQRISELGINKILACEVLVRDPELTPTKFNGSGLLILNPPYLLKEDLETYAPWLASALSDEGAQGSSGRCWWLTPEDFKSWKPPPKKVDRRQDACDGEGAHDEGAHDEGVRDEGVRVERFEAMGLTWTRTTRPLDGGAGGEEGDVETTRGVTRGEESLGRGRVREGGGERGEALPLEWDEDEEWGDVMLGDVDGGVEAGGTMASSYVRGGIEGKRGMGGGKSATSPNPRGKAVRAGKGSFGRQAAGGGIKWEDEGWGGGDDLPAPPAEQKNQIKSEGLLLDPAEKFDAGTYVDEDAVRGGRGGSAGDEALKFSEKRAREFGGKGLLKKRGVRQWGSGGGRVGQKVSW